MGKSTHFFGQSVFGQLMGLIEEDMVNVCSAKHNGNRYIKRFKTMDHLVSMLFCVFGKCISLREVIGGMIGLAGKTKHFKLNNLPYRSTLSDANKRRNSKIFGEIYNALLKKYDHVISDSRVKSVIGKQVKIFDSTTISLFKDILKCTGRTPSDGKRKGGIKAHTITNVDEKLPRLLWFSSAATNDHMLLEKLELNTDIIYVFDKGYNDYVAFKRFCDTGTGFVTRIKDNASYVIKEENPIGDEIHSGVLKDEIIEIQVKETSQPHPLKLRKVTFYDRVNKREFEFLTNLFEMRADMVAALYKLRWQIELLFKQLKQNFPLKYFLGDNENAIEIQIYCALIVNLLVTVIKKKLKRPWAFSNIVSFCRIHLFNYINLLQFLENPEKDWTIEQNNLEQLSLFERA
ncbi:IS4 family transposase [Candidatus Brachybacter algidus]|uniref:IS4 family transposase n=1 Tax=Candidatus Brachybacter algidus TaxID=2982024 RepID=UPI001D89CB01|nr:IS4 family transposase [Candidatus Brachybacter algidus]MBK6451018.1 IS4 family transposase [Candidatus Brachybacter algidus]MBK9399036.1 IS4 family transposase [Candidatus Brachybacter algidus]